MMAPILIGIASIMFAQGTETLVGYSATIQPWSQGSFEVSVDGGPTTKIERSTRGNMPLRLRRGSNTITVRYRNDGPKITRNAPNVFRLTTRNGNRRETLFEIRATYDNPRGTETITIDR